MKNSLIIDIVTILFTILFIYTGISKLMDYSIFKEQLADSPILSPVATPISILLPWTEFAIVALLLVPKWRLKGLIAAFVLMIAFTLYIIGILSFSENLPCSCGGVLAEMNWPQHIAFNGLFIIMALIGIILERRNIKSLRNQWISGNQSVQQ